MAALTVQPIIKSGLEASFAAADVGGDSFTNDGRTFLFVKNGATDVVVTITAQTTSATKPGFGDITLTNEVVTVTAGTEQMIGPLEQAIFNDASGLAQVTYDDTTNVTVAAVRLPISA